MENSEQTAHRPINAPSAKQARTLNKDIIVSCGIAAGVAILIGIVYLGSKSETDGFDVATVTCDNASLIRQAKRLIAESHSPLLGNVNILKAINFRKNSHYGTDAPNLTQYAGLSPKQISNEMFADRKHQCSADLVTNRGEMTMYYGWKVIGNDSYIEAQAIPVMD